MKSLRSSTVQNLPRYSLSLKLLHDYIPAHRTKLLYHLFQPIAIPSHEITKVDQRSIVDKTDGITTLMAELERL